jgi:hypothetical protein
MSLPEEQWTILSPAHLLDGIREMDLESWPAPVASSWL